MLALLITLSCSDKKEKDWRKEIPTFLDFQSANCDTSFKSTKPDFNDSNIPAEYRKHVRKQFSDPDLIFNCHYILSTVQLSNENWELYVFNSYDGKYIGTLHFRYGAEVSKESALIILDGIEDGKADKETQFWVVNDNKLEQIK